MIRSLLWLIIVITVLPALYNETHSSMVVFVVAGIYLRFFFEDVIDPFLDRKMEELENGRS